jgi:hypothetical protein
MNVDAEQLEHGDRVITTRDLCTSQELHIPEGAEGTIAEDRGSNLVVFFERPSAVARLAEEDLAKVDEDLDGPPAA